MIKNVIFDFGQVMVRFEPEYMVGRYVTDGEDAALLSRVIFDRALWDRLDAGTIEDSEVVLACKSVLPERLHDTAEKIYYNWLYNLPEIPGMKELVHELKTEHGTGVFLLSNISRYFAEHKDENPSLREFDGYVFSAVAGLTKPSAEIFAHICDKFSLDKESTIFVDDNEKNVKGALDFGLKAYLFDGDAVKLRDFIFKNL